MVQEYEIDHRTFQNVNLEDGKLYAVFFMDVTEDAAASQQAGRPIFKDTEFVRIVAPGDKTNVVCRPARQDDKARFAKQYAAFKRGDIEQVVGTPLKQWPAITRAMAEEFKHLGVLTVEHLADLRDDVKLRVPGAQDLSRRARAWLEATNGTDSKLIKVQEENNELRARLERLEASLPKYEDDEGEVATAPAAPPAVPKRK